MDIFTSLYIFLIIILFYSFIIDIVFVNFEQISHLVLELILLILNR